MLSSGSEILFLIMSSHYLSNPMSKSWRMSQILSPQVSKEPRFTLFWVTMTLTLKMLFLSKSQERMRLLTNGILSGNNLCQTKKRLKDSWISVTTNLVLSGLIIKQLEMPTPKYFLWTQIFATNSTGKWSLSTKTQGICFNGCTMNS